MAKATVAERFWAKVEKTDGCWLWNGARYYNGYGAFGLSRQKKGALAHRVAYLLTHGEIPEGQLILHRCDNPPCVRPDHLYAGSYSDNQRDTIARHPDAREALLTHRRRQVGELHNQAKLTAAQVREIRDDASSSQRDLAMLYEVSQSTINDIICRRTWRHI
jgi:HNH endonuclease